MYLLCNKIDYIKQEFKDCNAKCNLFKNVPHVCTFVNAYLKTLSLTMLLQSFRLQLLCTILKCQYGSREKQNEFALMQFRDLER